jgi:hypothetical protein
LFGISRRTVNADGARRDTAEPLVQPDHGVGIAEARRDDVFAEHTAVDRGDTE